MANNNIAAFRKRKLMSQTDLAQAIGTTLNMLGKLERGHRTLDTDWLEKIGRALGVAPHELIAPIQSDAAATHIEAQALVQAPVALPNAEVLTGMFEGLLESIDVDPGEGERAARLARSFPGSFQAALLPQAGRASVKQKIRAMLSHADAEDRKSP